ncbi:hypothetical protein ACGFNU_26100 [Spirillospora sp. NPDC048911]|uniref:hypothetical protein n=1 Tax=Spirillospora sp. NPDC048911 TaxID=3364527 RepID=UPI00371C7904
MGTATTRRRYAELDEIWARDEEIRLLGTLDPSVPADRLWRVRLTLRKPAGRPASARGHALRPFQSARRTFWREPGPFIATVTGDRFEVTVPIGSLALPLPLLDAQWDVHLVCEDEGEILELRVGRHRGVPPKAESITFPWQRVEGRQRFRVRPGYRAGGDLVLESRRTR